LIGVLLNCSQEIASSISLNLYIYHKEKLKIYI
jgi:hypothetical protein